MEERRREEQTKMSEDATRLMNERNNVFPEQNMDEDVTFYQSEIHHLEQSVGYLIKKSL